MWGRVRRLACPHGSLGYPAAIPRLSVRLPLSLLSALLRLSLCVILLLNGAGDAAARAWAQTAAAASHRHAAQMTMQHADPHARADCHMRKRTAPACAQGVDAAHQGHGEHCCKSSECHCAAAAQLLVPAPPALLHPHRPAARVLAFDASERAAPGVPPLIRPPIR